MMGSRVSPKQRMASFMPNQKNKTKTKHENVFTNTPVLLP